MPGGIGLLLLFGVIEVLRNILEPRIVGGQIGLHPIVTITSMYAGLKIAGFAGHVGRTCRCYACPPPLHF